MRVLASLNPSCKPRRLGRSSCLATRRRASSLGAREAPSTASRQSRGPKSSDDTFIPRPRALSVVCLCSCHFRHPRSCPVFSRNASFLRCPCHIPCPSAPIFGQRLCGGGGGGGGGDFKDVREATKPRFPFAPMALVFDDRFAEYPVQRTTSREPRRDAY
jgi:hypothetical protein